MDTYNNGNLAIFDIDTPEDLGEVINKIDAKINSLF